MPRLVKGGKHVYGWSEVGTAGNIAVPDEALEEYNLKTHAKQFCCLAANAQEDSL